MTNHCFITGANRGIGLGLCRDFLASGFHVIAGSRDPEATTLKELGRQYPGQLSSIKLPMDQLSDIDRASLVREDRDGRTNGVPVVAPAAPQGSYVRTG